MTSISPHLRKDSLSQLGGGREKLYPPKNKQKTQPLALPCQQEAENRHPERYPIT